MPAFSPIMLDLLRRHDFFIKKRLGQNFLVDPQVTSDILEASRIQPEDVVLEIGPGLGALTVALSEKASKVYAVELDRKLCEILREVLVACRNVEIIQEDIIHVDLKKLLKPYPAKRVKVVANLPYYVTTPILMNLLESHLKIGSLVVMVQKEVAERMAALPGNKTYGSLSIAVQYHAQPQIVRHVPPSAFVPQPKVDSSVVRMAIYQKRPYQPKDEELFSLVVRGAFGKRRKTLVNALIQAPHFPFTKPQLLSALERTKIDPQRRGETLSIPEFVRLSDALTRLRSLD